MPVKLFSREFFSAVPIQEENSPPDERVDVGGSESSWKCLFHVLKLYDLPPLFYNLTFYYASKWANTGCNGSFYPRKHFAETVLFT